MIDENLLVEAAATRYYSYGVECLHVWVCWEIGGNMMKRFLSTAAIVGGLVFFSSGAHASVMLSGAPAAGTTCDAKNSFCTELGNAGATTFFSNAVITLVGKYILTFTEIAQESGNKNTFTDGLGGTMSETTGGINGVGINFLTQSGFNPAESFSKIYGAGANSLAGLLFTSVGDKAAPAKQGDIGFGIFTKSATLGAGDVFFLAYDDQGGKGDDNHDDYIIRVSIAAVPLPAGVLMLGLGLGGLAAYRRRQAA